MAKKRRISKKAVKEIVGVGKEIPSKATQNIDFDKNWAFSFQSFQQRRYFGLNYEKVSKEWFISLLERFRSLSGQKIEEVMLNPQRREQHHFHSIVWEKSVLDREDFLELIPKEYRTEETDIVQFYITKSKGRVIGFFDAESVFNVVLLDPAHNMQLTRHRGHSAMKTDELPNCYLKMTNKFVAIKKKSENLNPSELKTFIEEISAILVDEGYCSKTRYVTIDESLFNDINEILAKDSSGLYGSLDFVIIDAIEKLKESLDGSERSSGE